MSNARHRSIVERSASGGRPRKLFQTIWTIPLIVYSCWLRACALSLVINTRPRKGGDVVVEMTVCSYTSEICSLFIE